MNERIRELAEQAGWMMSDEVEGFNTRLEKFVELIVRECATWIDKQPGWDGPYGHELMEHFGVEE